MVNQSLKELISVYRTALNRAEVSENEFWIRYALLIYESEMSQQDICELWCLPKQTINTITVWRKRPYHAGNNP